MEAIVKLLLGLVRLEDLDGAVADYEPRSGVWPKREACVALPVDLDLALHADPRALSLPVVARRWLTLPLAIGPERETAGLGIIQRRI